MAVARPRTGTTQVTCRFGSQKRRVEQDRILIIDGPVWTSAGLTTGIDLALAMIEQDVGADVARARLGNRSFITGAPAAVRSFRRCWIPSPNPTVSE